MDVKLYLERVLENIDKNIEFEIRFGKYDKISSNIKQSVFGEIYKWANKTKKFYYIQENIYEKYKQRTIYLDTNEIKSLFDNISEISIDEFVRISNTFKNVNEIHIIKKEEFRKPLSKSNYRLASNIEIINTDIKPSGSVLSKRDKFRCSWEDNMWIYDITIMLFTLDTKKKIYYEIEIELNTNKIGNTVHIDIYDNMVTNIKNILTVIDCYDSKRNIDVELTQNIYNSVATLNQDDLAKLIHSKYSVVDKTDGERKFLYIDNTTIWHANPTDKIVEKQLITKSANVRKFVNTLIDCELVDKTFYGFDILFYNNEDCRNLNLIERLKLLKIVMSELDISQTGCAYKVKKFYFDDIFTSAKYIWDNRKTLFTYNLDGLIFTPINGSYVGNLPNLKWKDKHSIDVRIFYNTTDNFTEFYPNSFPINKNGHVVNSYTSGNIIYYKSRIVLHENKYKDMNLVSKYGVLGVSGKLDHLNMIDILEFEFLPDEKKWVYLRTRNDKDTPNSFLSIKSALNAICEDITIEKLSKLKYIPSQYEKIKKDEPQCASKFGFSILSNVNYPMCEFYTYSYKTIINTMSGKRILILGCDICVIGAVLKTDYDDIMVIENDCMEVYGNTITENYKGLLEYVADSNKVNIIWGDSNLTNGLTAYRSSDRKLIKSMTKPWDVVFINSFELSFFNTKTEEFDTTMLDKYMDELRKITSKNASIIGIYLCGDKIKDYLSKSPCLIMRDGELNPLYKIIACAGDKILNIQRSKRGFYSEYQPIIYDTTIKNMLKKYNVKMETGKSIKSFYSEYKKNGGHNMSEYDLIVSDITKYFKFVFLNK